MAAGSGHRPWRLPRAGASDQLAHASNKLDYLAKVLVRTANLVVHGWFPVEYVGDYILNDALATDIPNRPRSHGGRNDD